MPELPHPDLSTRPFSCTITGQMRAPAAALYAAWTTGIDTWFAAPGQIQLRPELGEPFVFYTEHDGQRQPHYGRFLALEPVHRVELTWLTGADGTAGAETVVTVTLDPNSDGTLLRLTHAGFYDQPAADQHATAWEEFVLPHLDDVLTS